MHSKIKFLNKLLKLAQLSSFIWIAVFFSLGTNVFSEYNIGLHKFSIGGGVLDSAAYFVDIDFNILRTLAIHGGYTFSDRPSGKEVSERLGNYGNTKDGEGSYFSTFDLGIQKIFLKKWMILGGFSVGSRDYYQRYLDRRFRADHYYLVTKSKTIMAFDTGLTYRASDIFSVFLRHNDSVGTGIGIKLCF